MKNKTQRLLEIKNIISKEKISNQEELLHKLKGVGLNYTQATLSRDLKFLKVSRIIDEGKGYIYQLPNSTRTQDEKKLNKNVPMVGFKSLNFANNLGVIKTIPGYASGIASLIDNLNLFEVLGTIAGDDTILIIPNEGITNQDVINSLLVSIPDLKGKI